MKKIFTILAIAAAATSAWGQGTENLLRMSQQNFSLGTARTAAMGGAFTSLGADISSMSINPAGLAMYTRSEISISPGMRWNDITSSYNNSGHGNSFSDSKSKPVIGSYGGVFSSGNFAIGFSSNRLADFSSRRLVYGNNESFSMGDMFVEQLYGLSSNSLGGSNHDAFYNYSPILWNAIMGYQSALLDPTDQDGEYTMTGILNGGDQVAPQFTRDTKGAIDEFAISAAYTYRDILYFGFTLGIQDMYYNQYDQYIELADIRNNTGMLDNFTMNNNLRMSGTGINVKLGVTVRPVSWFRIGLSYHSPTWMNIDEESFSDMTVYGDQIPSEYGRGFSDTPLLVNDYQMRSPSRLLAGLSFTIADRMIISADYERTWYDKMKYSTRLNDYGYRPENLSNAVDNYGSVADNIRTNGQININNIISTSYRPTHNFRVGIEAQPITSLFLRAGYAYSQSPYKSDIITYSGKKASDYGIYQQISGGIGYRTRSGRFSIDAAYVYGFTEHLPYKFFDYTAHDGYHVTTNGYVTSKQKNNNVILTLAFRF